MVMKQLLTTVLVAAAVLTSVVVRADDDDDDDDHYTAPAGFSTTGKFFYTQVYYQPDDFQHFYVQMQLGCRKFSQKWVVTTQEESVGYVTTICNQTLGCNVPDRFPWAVSAEDNTKLTDECVSDVDQFIMNETARLNDGDDNAMMDPVPEFQLQGYSAKNRLAFTMLDFQRETVLDMKSFAIQQSNGQIFKSQHYSGYLGLAPYSSNTSIQYESILYHLKQDKLVDHAIVSLFMRNVGHSSIKFGSFDKAALHDYHDFTVVKTINKDSWAIAAVDPMLNQQSIEADKRDIQFLIDPQLSMIYIPADDYQKFTVQAEAIFKDGIDCSNSNMPCLFKQSCDHADIMNKDIPFQITIKDEQGSKDMVIKKENLLMNGNQVGLGDICLLSVFKYPERYVNQDIYYFGAPFLQQNYVSLSMEPWINGEGDYLKVGIGPICETAYLGEIQYDTTYSGFDPQEGDISERTSDADIRTDTSKENTCVSSPLNAANKKNNATAAAILGTLGGLLGITLIVGAIYIYRKRKMGQSADAEETNEDGSLAAPKINYGINTRGESVGMSIDYDNEEQFFGRGDQKK